VKQSGNRSIAEEAFFTQKELTPGGLDELNDVRARPTPGHLVIA
jgi:hypothetical protein